MGGSKLADLFPPLGYPGGSCHVVERIRDEVRSPRMKDRLIEQVESGGKLSNPDASKIYDLEVEQMSGLFKRMEITAHAQYRMDQRSVTVGDLKTFFQHYGRELNKWKSTQDWRYEDHVGVLQGGYGTVEWQDDKLGGLVVAFASKGRGTVRIVTTFWKGLQDPRGKYCPIRRRAGHVAPIEDLSGVKTFLDKQTEPFRTDRKKQVLPSGPFPRSKPTNTPEFNMPGESGSSPDGRSIHKDKARTKGTPGAQITLPDFPASTTINRRRPDVTAGMTGPPYPGANRQREQRGEAKRYDAKRYRSDRGGRKRKNNQRHRRLENNNRYIQDRERRDEHPERYERRPGGASSIAERSQEQRDKQAASIQIRQRPKHRQRKLRGPDKTKARQRYRKNRAQNKLRSKKRYKKLRRNPAFKKQQKIRRKNPERFRRRHAAVLLVPEIAFVIGKDLDLGYVRGVSGSTGLVTIYRHKHKPGATSASLESVPLEVFMAGVGFLSEADIEAMFLLIDAEIGLEAWGEITAEAVRASADLMNVDCADPEFGKRCQQMVGKSSLESMSHVELLTIDSGLVNQFTYDTAFAHAESEEFVRPNPPFYGLAAKVAQRYMAASFYREVKPPEMNSEHVYDRAQGHGDRLRDDRMPADMPEQGRKDIGVSNPGSRVLPWDKGHIDKAAASIQDIQKGCSRELLRKARNIRVRPASVRSDTQEFQVQGSSGNHKVKMLVKSGSVKVTCSCPFWQYQGPEYHARVGQYLFGQPRGKATKPGVKDPRGQHMACKHVLACFDFVNQGFGKQARYPSNSLGRGVVLEPSDNLRVKKVAARYLAHRRWKDA